MDWINNRMVVESELECLHREWFAESQNSAYKMRKRHTLIIIVVVVWFSVFKIKNGEQSPERLPLCGQIGCGDGMFGR